MFYFSKKTPLALTFSPVNVTCRVTDSGTYQNLICISLRIYLVRVLPIKHLQSQLRHIAAYPGALLPPVDRSLARLDIMSVVCSYDTRLSKQGRL